MKVTNIENVVLCIILIASCSTFWLLEHFDDPPPPSIERRFEKFFSWKDANDVTNSTKIIPKTLYKPKKKLLRKNKGFYILTTGVRIFSKPNWQQRVTTVVDTIPFNVTADTCDEGFGAFPWSEGAKRVAEGHVAIWKLVVSECSGWCFVSEDDAIWPAHKPSYLPAKGFVSFYKEAVCLPSTAPFDKNYLKVIRRSVPGKCMPYGAVAYAIHAEFASYLLTKLPMDMPVDHFLWKHAVQLQVGYVSTTYIAKHKKGKSLRQSVTLSTITEFGYECQKVYSGIGPDSLCNGIVPIDNPYMKSIRHGLNLSGSGRAFLSKPMRFSDFEFSCYSQTTEDGVLLSILESIGVTNRRGVEIAGGLGWENNLANLVINFGFETLFFDGDPGNVRCARNFFKHHPSTRHHPPVFADNFVSVENINSLIESKGWSGPIDVFSLDIDGVDYWIWDAIEIIQPRVVVVEIQEVWGPEERWTRPYDSNFHNDGIPSMGASLAAFDYLARKKGYRLVGCVKAGFNAFFVSESAANLDEIFGSGSYDRSGCFAHVDEHWRAVLDKRRKKALEYSWVDPKTGKYLSNSNTPFVADLQEFGKSLRQNTVKPSAYAPPPLQLTCSNFESSVNTRWVKNTCTMHSFDMAVHSIPDIVSDRMVSSGCWEKDIITQIVQHMDNQRNGPTKLFLDIGANIGAFTSTIASLGHEVIAVEPFKMNVPLIRATMCRHDFNIHLYKVGLADTSPGHKMCIWSTNDKINNGNARMTPYFEGIKDFGTDKHKKCMEVIHTYTLDELLFGSYKLDRPIDAMKIDIEGFETRAFRGAKRLLNSTFKPKKIWFEFQKQTTIESGTSSTELYDTLTSSGYEIIDFRKSSTALSRKDWQSVSVGDFLANLQVNVKVAVAIPTYNRAEYVKLCADALHGTVDTKDVWVFDDHSSDYSTSDLKKWFCTENIHRNEKRLKADGQARAVLEWFVKTDYDWLVTLDSDLIVRADWISIFKKMIPKTQGVISLYHSGNIKNHPALKCDDDLCEMKTLGNAGVAWSRILATKMLTQMKQTDGFDWGWTKWLQTQKIPQYAMKKSLVLHVGMHGTWGVDSAREKSIGFPMHTLSPDVRKRAEMFLNENNSPF